MVLNSGGKPTKYGFTEKVIDSMRVEIRSIVVKFQDPTFHAKLEITDIVIQSTTPEWTPAESLKQTRLALCDLSDRIVWEDWSTCTL